MSKYGNVGTYSTPNGYPDPQSDNLGERVGLQRRLERI